jgi:nucleoside-diphosphate-sugar epimerase
MQHSKILLTGSHGFIGSHYYKHLQQQKAHVVPYDKKIRGEDLTNKATTQLLPDYDVVVHLAATNGTNLFYEQPTDVLINNTIPTINLIERYRNTDTKFVFASTCEIFNGAIDAGYYHVPTDEQVPVVFNDITNPRWSYSIPKALGENLVANSGLEYLIIRYFNVYGPGQVDHFINEFVERCKQGLYYINGNDTRSFCYIDDAVKMTDNLVNNCINKTVNVGNDNEVTISTVAKLIMGYMGINPDKLEVLPGPKGSVTRRCPDTTLVQMLTGFTDYTPLEVGLKKTVESLL